MNEEERTYSAALVASVVRRYADAYIVARTIDAFGLTIKGVGVAIGVLLALVSLFMVATGGGSIAFLLAAMTIAGAITIVLVLLGTLASAQGQVLKASLDTAVNTSRFLSDRDRAQIMSLPFGVAPPGGSVVGIAAPPSDWRCGCGQVNPATANACLDCGVTQGVG